ncbi:hypothetical protein V6N12_027617 [Hibiscus sabdariffa]|uniref:Protein kinase domain-containing protein n=1 Tax=Hibiscus sabdariffa TaxID=183260 RepID=A0ABR2F3G4_9ROSI
MATGGFKEESVFGRESFSCVYKGVLEDGTIVAVKQAIISSDKPKNSKAFHTELDLLSRLNLAHLLNLLGYCEEGENGLLSMSSWLMDSCTNIFMERTKP